MSVIINNGSIYVEGKIQNDNESGVQNNSHIYLGRKTPLTQEKYKINSNIYKIPLSLEQYNSKISPSNINWIGYNPKIFGTIMHSNNLADLEIIESNIEDTGSVLNISINIQNTGGFDTTGYILNNIKYDFHAIYELSDTEVNEIDGILYPYPIVYTHESKKYWLKKYIRSTDTIIFNDENSYININSNYRTIIDPSLSEGILTFPVLQCSDKFNVNLSYDKNRLKTLLDRKSGDSVNLLFIADDVFYNLKGDTTEIVDTNSSINNNCVFIKVNF